MNKLIAILLLVTISVTGTPLQQFVKLPVLVSHFYEHKQKNSKLGLLQFLKMHYAISDDKDGDRERDKQLPFKQCGHYLFMSASTPPSKITFEDRVECTYHYSVFHSPLHNDDVPNSSYLDAIWQPPRNI